MRASSQTPASDRRAGLTLIEAVAAITVLGIAIPPLLSLFTGIARAQANRSLESAAMVVADSLMEEIASKAFEDPDLSSGSFGAEEATRLEFDDVDDFHDLSLAPPTRLDGTPIPGLESLTATVTVAVIDGSSDPFPAGQSNGLGVAVTSASLIPSLEGFKEITVVVSWAEGDHQLVSLRAPGGSGFGDGESEPEEGPIDGELAASTAIFESSRRFGMNLTNETSEVQSMTSISVSADGDHPSMWWILHGGALIVPPTTPIPLPTGDLDLTGLPIADRSFQPNQTVRMRILFQTRPPGTFNYEIVITFADGSASLIPLTLNW